MTVEIHEIAADGLPDLSDQTGHVALIFDGCIVSGWPLYSGEDYDELPYSGDWEANSDVGRHLPFIENSVTHWVRFPVPLWQVARGPA